MGDAVMAGRRVVPIAREMGVAYGNSELHGIDYIDTGHHHG
jgi:hypothetical protein